MSSFNKSSRFSSSKKGNVTATAVKPFCKVCKDAGKSEAEYTSHFVRENPDPSSKVVCPTLLALQCTYCDGSGHTVSYCKVLEKRKKDEAKFQRMEKVAEEKAKVAPPVVAKKITNAFAALCSDSSDSESEQVKVNKKSKKNATNKNASEVVLKVENKNANANAKATVVNEKMKMPGKVTEEDFPQLNPSAIKKEVKAFGFGAIAIKVREEEEQFRLEQEEAELTARLEEIQKKKQPVPFKTPVHLPSRTQVAVAPKKEVKDVIKSIGVARTFVPLSSVPLPPVFTTQPKSLFEKPEYLQDMHSVSDDDDDEEEEEYKPRMLVFDRAEIDDEDW